MARPLALVVVVEAFPYPMRFHPNYRVLLRIKIGSTPQGFHGNFRLGHMADPGKELVAGVLEKAAGIRVTGKQG